MFDILPRLVSIAGWWPRKPDREQGFNVRGNKAVYRTILLGTYAVATSISILSLVSLNLGNEQATGALAACAAAAVYIVIIWICAQKSLHQTVACLLVAFYMLLAAGIVWIWGINTPIGLLLFGVVIVLAGILLSARYAPLAASMAGLILLGIQTAILFDWHVPDMSWTGKQSSYGDALSSCIIFGVLALVSWLYNHEMERSLMLAKQAEITLSQQKEVLRQKVKKRTAQLRQAQLEEMQEMYRFAELGQLGVTLLHDLANHLTSLTLEIEGLQSQKSSIDIARTREITGYLKEIVDSTRARLYGRTQKQTFDTVRSTNEVINFLSYKASESKVSINWNPPAHSWKYTGDPVSFSQVIAILVSNAIDAYSNTDKGWRPSIGIRQLHVTMRRDKAHIVITISDWGKGIPKSQRKQLFKPFQTTKKAGMGIGLFIARQTVAINFKGTLTLNPKSDHTEFIIKLPIQNGR